MVRGAAAPLPVPLPVTVIGGFLGAGKTTLVNHILGGDHGLRVAVMVNDFGAINIDAALITSTEGGLYSLANGCICCSLNQGLVEQLEELLATRADIDHIVIEASGVADPARIMDAVRYSRFASRLRGDAVVVMVDAAGFEDAIAAAPGLAEAQIGSADLLVLNKTDLTDRGTLDAWRARWSAPDSRAIETVNARVPFDILFAGETAPRATVSTIGCDPVYEQATSAIWCSEGTVDLKRLQGVLARLPLEIYRAKGVVRDNTGRVFAVHVVGSRLSFAPLALAPLDLEASNTIALIGFGKRPAYERILVKLDECIEPRTRS